jgi:membrane protein
LPIVEGYGGYQVRVPNDTKPAPTITYYSGVERLLAPIVAAALFLTALAKTLRGPREEPPKEPAKDAASGVAKSAEDKGLRARLMRVRFIGSILRVQSRYGELKGNNLSAAVAFQSFLSLFPLLLVLIAVIGLLARSEVDVGGAIIRNLGLSGEAAKTVTNAIATAAKNPKATGPIGLAGLLWSGLGLVDAFQYALDQVWQVEARGIKDKVVGMLWLGGAVVLFVAASAVTTVVNWLPGYAAALGIAAGLVVNFALWMWTFKVLPNRKLPWRALVPGALVGAVGMEALKVAGAIYVPRAVASSSALYGTLGVVLAVLAWLFLFSRLVVYASVVNVLKWEARVGTVETTIEVPAGRGIQPTDDVNRAGRVERADAAA